MKYSLKKLKELVSQVDHISSADFDEAIKEAEEKNKSVEDILTERDLISNEHIGQIIADASAWRFINLRKEAIKEDVLKIIPELTASQKQVIAFAKDKKGLKIAATNPDDQETIKWLEKKTGEKVIPYYCTKQDFRDALQNYHPALKQALEKITTLSIAEMVDILIQYAYENRASDIHIQPHEKETIIRFRIDGVLHTATRLPKDKHDLIISRIKVLAKLRTDEHFTAQDGKFQFAPDDKKFDIRVSVVPITKGEKVVMRLLSEKVRRFRLEDLGFSSQDLKKIKKNIEKPYGMILSTGPTGCGKTTTLYAILKILNKPEVNISTIEDPVEYDIEGVNQIQVNPKTNLTFAKGLRSIVRQDPNIIMVGEIRDEEAAKIAINSAMTGQLVLSTMHANTAATIPPRLTDMGIEPFLIASSVDLIIAQRLVRRICLGCVISYRLTKKQINAYQKIFPQLSKITRLYKGKGCEKCNQTGYSGRIGIFEILEMKNNIQDLIMQKATADQIQKQALENGMKTMADSGLDKVQRGITTIEEIARITKEEI